MIFYLISHLHSQFFLKDLADFSFFLVLKVSRTSGGIHLCLHSIIVTLSLLNQSTLLCPLALFLLNFLVLLLRILLNLSLIGTCSIIVSLVVIYHLWSIKCQFSSPNLVAFDDVSYRSYHHDRKSIKT